MRVCDSRTWIVQLSTASGKANFYASAPLGARFLLHIPTAASRAYPWWPLCWLEEAQLHWQARHRHRQFSRQFFADFCTSKTPICIVPNVKKSAPILRKICTMICAMSERHKSAQNQCTKNECKNEFENQRTTGTSRGLLWLPWCHLVSSLESTYPGLASLALIMELCQNCREEHLTPQWRPFMLIPWRARASMFAIPGCQEQPIGIDHSMYESLTPSNEVVNRCLGLTVGSAENLLIAPGTFWGHSDSKFVCNFSSFLTSFLSFRQSDDDAVTDGEYFDVASETDRYWLTRTTKRCRCKILWAWSTAISQLPMAQNNSERGPNSQTFRRWGKDSG